MTIYNNNNNISTKIRKDTRYYRWHFVTRNWQSDILDGFPVKIIHGLPSLPSMPVTRHRWTNFFHVRRVKYGRGMRAYPDIGIFGGCPVPTGGTTHESTVDRDATNRVIRSDALPDRASSSTILAHSPSIGYSGISLETGRFNSPRFPQI